MDVLLLTARESVTIHSHVSAQSSGQVHDISAGGPWLKYRGHLENITLMEDMPENNAVMAAMLAPIMLILEDIRDSNEEFHEEVRTSFEQLRLDMAKYAVYGIKAYNNTRGYMDTPFEAVPFPSGQLPQALGAQEHYEYVPLNTFDTIDSLNMLQTGQYLTHYSVPAHRIPGTLIRRKQMLAFTISGLENRAMHFQ
ncbi:hypothetical protein OF83DRAFT_1202303 [Amylostereum chailletii]|nr:hypothetical protein OF83DRAFT_1202303 [Amylostereum chailletii]